MWLTRLLENVQVGAALGSMNLDRAELAGSMWPSSVRIQEHAQPAAMPSIPGGVLQPQQPQSSMPGSVSQPQPTIPGGVPQPQPQQQAQQQQPMGLPRVDSGGGTSPPLPPVSAPSPMANVPLGEPGTVGSLLSMDLGDLDAVDGLGTMEVQLGGERVDMLNGIRIAFL